MMSRLLLLLGLCFLASNSAFAQVETSPAPVVNPDKSSEVDVGSQSMSDDFYRYGLNIRGDNIRVELRVNDISVLFRILRNGEELDYTFNEWLRKGANYIELRVDRFNERQPYKVKFNFFFQSPTQVTSDVRQTLYVSPEEMLLPWRQNLKITLKTMPSIRLWQTEDYKLDDENKLLLIDAINLMRSDMLTALSEANNGYLATYEKPIRDQINLAYGRLPESDKEIMDLRKQIADKFAALLNERPHITEPVALDQLIFEQVADRKLVRVSRKDGSPLISAGIGDLEYAINRPIFGLIGGVWERLR
jgi:hypothetical protein